MPTRLAFVVLVAAGIVAAANPELQAQSPVTYVYDNLGRLVGVVNGTGESAVYVYDAVGNVLSIERHSAGAVSIISFTPDTGPTGTTVTVFGTGFSSTPSQNTLTFNGVAASITSSTSTQIAAVVPAGATSGTIAVTTPSGSASSSTPFTVANAATPTISSFTPTAGVAGTAVTISGTNFDATAANDRVTFNVTHATVGSSSPTSLSATVPLQTGSGRIKVATPKGLAVGNDFFVPPSPYVATDIGFSSRATLGQSLTVSLAANKIGLVVFDGTAGQRVSMVGSNGTIAGYVLGCDAPVSLLKPDNTVFVSSICMEGSGFMDTVTLPVTGTYSVLVDPASTAAGNLTLTIYNVPADISGSITSGGSAVTVTTTVPGQNAKLTFSGSTNQRVFVTGTNGVSGQIGITCDISAVLVKPDGSTLASSCMEGSGIIDTQTLPATGTYTILVDPTSWVTGSLTLALSNVPADVTGSITADGSLVSATNTAAGQNAIFQFSGTVGQRVSLAAGAGPGSTVTIRKPNGTSLGSVGVGAFWPGFIDTKTLTDTGTHSVLVDYSGTNTGTIPLRLYTVPADVTGSVTINGSSAPVSVTVPGQNGSITFSGTANQQVTVHVTGNTIPWVNVALRKPDGSVVTGTWNGAASFNLAQVTLTVTGTYSISIDLGDANTGSMNVAVTSP